MSESSLQRCATPGLTSQADHHNAIRAQAVGPSHNCSFPLHHLFPEENSLCRQTEQIFKAREALPELKLVSDLPPVYRYLQKKILRNYYEKSLLGLTHMVFSFMARVTLSVVGKGRTSQ